MNFNILSNTFLCPPPDEEKEGKNLFTKRQSRCLHSGPQSLLLAFFSYRNFHSGPCPHYLRSYFIYAVCLFMSFFLSTLIRYSHHGELQKKNIISQFHSSFFFFIRIDYFSPTLRLCKNIIRGHRCTSLCNFHLNIPNIQISGATGKRMSGEKYKRIFNLTIKCFRIECQSVERRSEQRKKLNLCYC